MSYHDYFQRWDCYDKSDKDDVNELKERISELDRGNQKYETESFTTPVGERYVALRVLGTV